MGLGAVLFIAVTGVAVWGRSPEERPLEAVAVTVFGAVYCGGTLAFGYALRHHAWTVDAISGTALLLYPLVVTWATDIGAYVVGRALGRQRLMPSVSPGKTVAGGIGGLVFALLASLVYNATILRPKAHLSLTILTAVGFAIIASLAAQIGDLAESLFKREAGVKDSSLLLPGHGGILDRLDSIYFVLPVAYLYLGRFLLPAPT
jgi:phosphatidate cytidylyltransferase